MPCLLRILFEHPSGGGTSGRGLSDGNGEEHFLLFPMFMEGHTNKTRNTTFFNVGFFGFLSHLNSVGPPNLNH